MVAGFPVDDDPGGAQVDALQGRQGQHVHRVQGGDEERGAVLHARAAARLPGACATQQTQQSVSRNDVKRSKDCVASLGPL